MLTDNNDMTDELLVSYLLQEATPENRLKVERWVEADPSNKRYFDHFQLILDSSQTLPVPPGVDENQAWQKFRQRTAGTGKVRNLPSSLYWRKMVVAIVVCITAVAMIWQLSGKIFPGTVTLASAETPVADTLPDGSVAVLNKHSSISYAGFFSRKAREVTLSGEAFFTVQPDRNKPFTVRVNDITITVLGTSFNVRNAGSRTEVIVASGSVKVERHHKSLILQKGEKIRAENNDTALIKSAAANTLYDYYRSHEFVCDSTPLWQLVEVLNEAYGSHIIIENETLRNLPLTATFSNAPLNKILGVISETFSISVVNRDDKIILK